MKNIVFSTTRQWNPGDEIILKGVIRLLNSFGIKFNPLIFNETDINPPAELGRLADASGDKQSTRI